MRDEDLPDDRQDDVDDELAAALRGGDSDAAPGHHRLKDEIAALLDDGKTYAEAEFAYQKSRLAYAADRGKSAALLLFFALSFIHLALIGIVIGLIIALAPELTALGATGVVVGALLIGAAIMVAMLRSRSREIGEAFEEGGE
jgi:uncharacterized membrane protein YqjE